MPNKDFNNKGRFFGMNLFIGKAQNRHIFRDR